MAAAIPIIGAVAGGYSAYSGAKAAKAQQRQAEAQLAYAREQDRLERERKEKFFQEHVLPQLEANKAIIAAGGEGLTPEEITALVGTTEGGIEARIANERERLTRAAGEGGLAGSPAITAALTGLQETGIQEGAGARIQSQLADIEAKRRSKESARANIISLLGFQPQPTSAIPGAISAIQTQSALAAQSQAAQSAAGQSIFQALSGIGDYFKTKPKTVSPYQLKQPTLGGTSGYTPQSYSVGEPGQFQLKNPLNQFQLKQPKFGYGY